MRIENNLEEGQYGFQPGPGQSTTDLIFSIRQLIKKHFKFGQGLWMGFLDISKAFNAMVRTKVWQCLRNIGMNEDMVEQIRKIFEGTCSKVKTKMGVTDTFYINTVLHQGGGVLSPLLFILVMSEVQKRVQDVIGE
jgi:Reverse transcriptase (RNA-dependent DNA polymerase).